MFRNRSLFTASRMGIVGFAAVLLWPGSLFAQQQPVITSVGPQLILATPAGGQAGSTFEVAILGQHFDDLQGLYFSQPGIKAELTSGSQTATYTGGKMGKGGGGKQDQFATGRFKVTIAAGTRLGVHDVRVVTASGISNPRAFVVGDLKEYVEAEPNNDVPQAQKIDLNSTVSGTVSAPTDVDYFQFTGKKGQRVIVSCLTTSVDSKLDPELQLYGPTGNLLGINRHYHKSDALLDAVLPADGDYMVRVCSFAYVVGGQDYFYRLSVSTAPWIDAIFPSSVEPGKDATLTVYGRNLPGGKADASAVVDGRVLDKVTVKVKAPADAKALHGLDYSGLIAPPAGVLDGFEYRLRNEAGSSNPFLLTFARAPVVLDAGKNNTTESAQKVKLPCEIAGRIDKKGERDWYSFEAKRGDVYTIDVLGERIGAPHDLYLTLRNADGRVLTEIDDNIEIMSNYFYMPSNDPPRYRFAVPADGTYQIMVTSRDAFVQSGPRYFYTVRITPEQPDFQLIALPPVPYLLEACVVPKGGHQLYNVLVWRQDGFSSEITLTAEGLPPGVTCRPQIVPPGVKQAPLVVSAAANAGPWAGDIKVRARATVNGKELVRDVRSASVSWPLPQQQANTPAISRLDRSLVLAVGGPAPFTLTAEKDHFVVQPGGKATVPVRLARLSAESAKQTVQVVVTDLPQTALTFQPFTFNPGKDTGDAVLNVKTNATPGSYTVVLRGQAQIGMPQGKGNQKKNVVVQQPSTPITITVAPSRLAKVTVTPQTVKLKPGGQTEVTVRVARMYDFDGAFKVQVMMPANAKGWEAKEVTIPAGADEAKVVIHAAPNATIGSQPNLTFRLTGLFHGKVPTTQDASLVVSVSSK